ncbi:MAG: ATP-dependent Clp protease ATP-binding subunit [Clostridiales bacterium]|nr:ATP-dependent Clp protease ATP-binding subunit [Clostridiales bacterium]
MAKDLRMTDNLEKAMEIAQRVSGENGAHYVGSEHMLYGFLCLKECTACQLLASEGIFLAEYEAKFLATIDKQSAIQGLTPRTATMLNTAMRMAMEAGMQASTAHFLLTALDSATCVAVDIIRNLGADVRALREKTRQTLVEQKWKKEMNWQDSVGDKPTSTPSQTPTYPMEKSGLSKKEEKKSQTKDYSLYNHSTSKKKDDKLLPYGIDLTERAKQGKIDPVVGRKKEIEKVTQVLSRRSKNNPVLIGEPGVGKSAIVEGLANLIVEGNVPEQLLNKRLFSVDIPGMIAGARYRGDFEERLKDLVDTVLKDGDVLLFIDEIHTIVGAGSSSDNSMDAANILKPMLARGDLQVIGATTIEEYRKYIEKDGALERRFTPVQVDEPSIDDAITILKGLRLKYEGHHGLVITDESIETAVKLSARYITDRFLPDKAIDLIDEAAARARITLNDSAEIEELKTELVTLEEKQRMYKNNGDYAVANELSQERLALQEKIVALKKAQAPEKLPDGRLALGKEQVAAIVSARMKIPLMKITQEEGEKLMRLEDDLHKRIIGQEEGVSAVAKAIRRARAGLKDPSRPIGSFIFVGPTGVGKTDLCKALSEALFGSEEQMIRLDMSEYMEKQSVSKLIGAPPGYVGYDEGGGQLTDKVRTTPYCVVLFDEIEKAHPDVFNLLLQILDDGRLTDSKGRTVSFKNAVVIMTSNVGASMARTEKTGVYGFGSDVDDTATDEKQYDEMKENITTALKEKFKPEFLNRLDDVIVFHRLTEENARKIAEKMVDKLSKRLLEQRGISLVVTASALKKLVEEGYDSQYGARPLKRVIQRRIEDRLSEEILLGKIRNGQKVTIDYIGNGFVVDAY